MRTGFLKTFVSFTLEIFELEMNSQVDHTIVWLFQFCSFLTPIQPSQFSLQAFASYLWCFFHFVVANLQLVTIYIRHNDTFHDGSTIGKILDIIQVIGPILAHIVMLIETNLNRTAQKKMWEVISNIEDQAIFLAKGKYSFLKSFIIEMLIMFFVCNVTEAYILSTITENPRFARSWYFRLWSLHMLRVGVAQIVFYVEFIRCYVQLINNELLEINPNDVDSPVIIANIKKMYMDIHLFSMYLNERFAWSILALMIHFFLALIISFYWIVANLYFGVLRFFVASSIICVSPMASLLVVVYSCEQCVREVNNLGHSIHRLWNMKSEATSIQSIVNQISKVFVRHFSIIISKYSQIHQFSLQVKILPILFSGFGFFNLDFPFLFDVKFCYFYSKVNWAIQSVNTNFLISDHFSMCFLLTVNIFIESRSILRMIFMFINKS